MATIHNPRKGSLAFSPRKRAKSPVARFGSWPESEGEPKIQGFAGYKAGMTHLTMIDDSPHSLTEGMEISVPATVIEVPAMKVAAIRVYSHTPYGTKSITEAWAKKLDPELNRLLPVPKKHDAGAALKRISELVSKGTIDDVRILTYTLPKNVGGIPKKKPDMMENRIGGGDIPARFEYAKSILGKEIKASDVFNDGELVDVAAITTGKGTQGPVKRWGVKLRKRKHARTGKKRHIGTLGPWHPARVSWRVPQLGQTGYHQRTEFNKRILQIGVDGNKITPEGGFLNYGIVKNMFILIKGTVPGPVKRLVRIRTALRPKMTPKGAPEIRHVSVESKQG
ncbi:MAG: 50S ribosomal protein L3 [Methanosarcinales archaeon]|nr:MAG: 50S ribosomal protein L3 [Methanosarcinales archaeon]